MDLLTGEMNSVAREIDKALGALLPPVEDYEAEVFEAMRYALLAGGKRLRPFLVLASAALFDVPIERARRAACALECVHTYSLVHDDLPCMDDDDMRRGKPTTHKKFGEATAVLAGDALLTLAFEILSDEATHHDPKVRADLVLALAQAAGAHGMVGGQMIDMLAETTSLDIGAVTRLQQMKTGALICASVRLGAIAAGLRQTDAEFQTVSKYGRAIGLAFQIKDDLLDATGSTEVIGKRSGADASHDKPNFVSLLGVSGAQAELEKSYAAAIAAANEFGAAGDRLTDLANLVSQRTQ